MAGKSELDLSVIVPMFNEEANVAATVARISVALEPFHGQVEILLVNDGSTDRTLEVAQALARANNGLRVVTYGRNRGRGKALRAGFDAARGRYVVSIDADLSYDPRYILELVQVLIDDDQTDLVLASPYMEGGGTDGVPWDRLWVSRAGNWILRQAIDGRINTTTGIFRAYRREVLESLELESDGKEIHLEILSKALALGYRVKEVPAILRTRRLGKSKFRFRATAFSHIVFTFFERPLILFGVIGLLFTLLGLAGAAYVVYLWRQSALNPERPLMTLVVLLILAGVQVLSFGFIGTQLVMLRREVYRVQGQNRMLARRLARDSDDGSEQLVVEEELTRV